MTIPAYTIGSTATAIVTIRIPSSGDNLTTDAEERLERANDVTTVTVDGLRDMDPQLSATVVTLEVTVEMSAELAIDKLQSRLATSPGVEAIRISP